MMIFCSFKVVFLFLILLLESNQVEVFLCFTCFYEKREFACLPEIFRNLTINKPQNRCLIPINLSILPLFQKILFLKKKNLWKFSSFISTIYSPYLKATLLLSWELIERKLFQYFTEYSKLWLSLKLIVVNFFLSKVAWLL